MTVELLAAFSVYALVALVTPGPNNIMLLASGLNFGIARSIPHITGVAGGFTLMVVIVGMGLGAVFKACPYAYVTMQFVGAAYLLYLAWKIANSGPLSLSGDESAGKPMGFLSAVIFQWVNPKAWIMAVGAVSIYAPHENYFVNVLVIALIFGLIGFPSAAMWASFGTVFRRFFTHERHMKIFNISMAFLLVVSICPTLSDLFKRIIG